MINFDDVTKETAVKIGRKFLIIHPDHPYRTLIVGSSGSGRINSFFNLINL